MKNQAHDIQTAERLLDDCDLQVYFGCTQRTLQNWVVAGHLQPTLYVEGKPRYTREGMLACRAIQEAKTQAIRAEKVARAKAVVEAKRARAAKRHPAEMAFA